MRGTESQRFSRRVGIGDQVGRIARAARLDDMGYLAAGLGRNGGQDLSHRKARPGAKIEGAAAYVPESAASAPKHALPRGR